MEQAGVKTTILVVDDDESVRELLCSVFEAAGYSVETAADGQQGLRTYYTCHPDLVILDIRMPGLDGWQLLERIREMSQTPVIMLTALGEEDEKVRGLGKGADDYLAKPFGRAELLARAEAVLRRVPRSSEAKAVYEDQALLLDWSRHQVYVRGTPAELSPLEFRLLTALVRNAGNVLSADRLLDICWDERPAGPTNVRVHISSLRKKLEEDPARPHLIETVREFGYRYRPSK